MREVNVFTNCVCGFWKDRVFYTNEYGYFEIPQSYCPNCFNILIWEVATGPVDIKEYYNVGVKDANKR